MLSPASITHVASATRFASVRGRGLVSRARLRLRIGKAGIPHQPAVRIYVTWGELGDCIVKWFRFYHSIIDSLKVRTLAPEAQLDYVLLLCCASEFRERTGKNTGETGLILSAAVWRTRSETLERTFPAIAAAELAYLDDLQKIVMSDWIERQFASDDVTARAFNSKQARKAREAEEKRGNVAGNVAGNVGANTPETDSNAKAETDTNRREDLVVKTGARIPPWLEEVPEWRAFTQHRTELGKALKPTATALLVSKLERLRQEGLDPAELLNTSIEQGWSGVFDPRKKRIVGKRGGSGLTRENSRKVYEELSRGQ